MDILVNAVTGEYRDLEVHTDATHLAPVYSESVSGLSDPKPVTDHNWTSMERAVNGSEPMSPSSPTAVIGLSLLFCTVGVIGLTGNALVMFIIMSDKKMRRSVTNMFIMNLALADFLIMLFGIPEIVQFMLHRGWLLGLALCKFQRYVLVVSLYASIMTLVAVCVERYVAIVHPIQAHILCSRRRIMAAISAIWPLACICGLPIAVFNQVTPMVFNVDLCVLLFPNNNKQIMASFKLAEFSLYFLGPVIIQVCLYSIVCKRLFAGTENLHRKRTVQDENGGHREKDSDAIKARKGVVKMLIASVCVYFLSYAPLQVPTFYNLISATPFKHNWSFIVLIHTLGYVNSAANPILYSIFSQNFRRQFHRVLCCCSRRRGQPLYMRTTSNTSNTLGSHGNRKHVVRFTNSRLNTTMTSVSEM